MTLYVQVKDDIPIDMTSDLEYAQQHYDHYISTEYDDYQMGYPKWLIVNDEIILNPDYEDLMKQEEKVRINQLHMTPLDFIKCLEEKGVSYSTIIGLCNQNAEVDKQLRFCNHVYRGNELLDQLAGGFGITSEELDEMFINKN